uniref:AlNc14C358G10971 protein n=1 Tax=Albugo laibachii Nc14 TaxID=890382 RepID=F0WXM1_9STRA|nr:AlNc14C358G10971 [Albugo laibachii Nc14]|eukprot:CCA26215.1 AlNc14C358G10971 [Albugo laibachii Nc14]
MVSIDISSFPSVTLSADFTSTASFSPSVVTSNTKPNQSDSPEPPFTPSEESIDVEPTPSPTLAAPPNPMQVDDTNASSSSPPMFNEPVTKSNWSTLVKGHEEIRKDKAAAKAKSKVDIPKHIASELKAIDQLFEEGRPTWDVLSAHLTAAKPFAIPTARLSVVLETGQVFVHSPPAHILQMFARDHGNKILGNL